MQFWAGLVNFFNSNFFIAISTFLTVAGAIILYKLQQRGEKQQIARLLINEIRNAESAIQSLKYRPQEGIRIPELRVLPQNSWNKYAHLFTKDFDQDGIVRINRFFSDAERIDYLVSQGNSMELFLQDIRQRSDAIQHKILDLIYDSLIKKENIKTNFKNFSKRLDDATYAYVPKGFSGKLTEYLQNIPETD